MKTMMKKLALAGGIVLAIASCDNPDLPGTEPAPAGSSFYVDMTDSPANFSRMDVEITGVEVYHDSQGWITLNTSIRSLNLLSLANGVTSNIAVGSSMQAGHYSRVRIRFSDNNSVRLNAAVDLGGIHFAAGSTVMLKWATPERFVDVTIDKTITADRGARVVLDFDAESSVTEGIGVFLFKPVISQMVNASTGARGVVVGGDAAAFIKLSDGTRTYSAYSTYEGRFLIRGMMPGTYRATIRVMQRNDAGIYEEHRYERDGVKVTLNSYADMGTIRF